LERLGIPKSVLARDHSLLAYDAGGSLHPDVASDLLDFLSDSGVPEDKLRKISSNNRRGAAPPRISRATR
jgi:hypothetical protein